MGSAARQLMEADEFLVWCLDQENRWELIEGVPVEMMARASEIHDRIAVNVIISLGNQLRGGPCRPTTADIALRTRIRSVRRPDVMVTCDPPRGDVYDAQKPRMVVEVLSASNVGVAWDRKLREYRRREDLAYILLIDSKLVGATLYVRTGQDWADQDFDRLSQSIELPLIGCRLVMADVYEATGLNEAPEQ